jgi:hypothetical protein
MTLHLRECIISLKSRSTYSPSKQVDRAELGHPGEKPEAFDLRTWKMKAHTNADGMVVIPCMAFKKALTAAASLTQRKIAGKGNQTWAKQVRTGALPTGDLVTNVKIDDVRGEIFQCSATGDASGNGPRVPRKFPMVDAWEGDIRFVLTNAGIEKDIFEEYFNEAGLYIGVGRFRPENGGVNGLFDVVKFEWNAMN